MSLKVFTKNKSKTDVVVLRFVRSGQIEVFGSNQQGIHGAGHAAHAVRYCGAIPGQGEGRMNQCYALPTKSTPYRSLNDDEILAGVLRLYEYALANPNERFLAGRVGCGLAGFSDDHMINLIARAGEVPGNLRWPNTWMETLSPARFYNAVIIAGSRSFGKESPKRFDEIVEAELEFMRRDKGVEPCIITGMAPNGGDLWALEYSRANGINRIECPAEWNLNGKVSGHLRNQMMAQFGSRLMAFYDGTSPGTRRMIEIAKEYGLVSHVLYRGDFMEDRPLSPCLFD